MSAALRDLQADAAILELRLYDGVALLARLGPDQLVLTIPASPTTAAGGRVRPGDDVVVIASYEKGKPSSRTQVAIPRAYTKNPAGGIHHMCFEVNDLLAARDDLKAKGMRVLGDGEPKIGAHDMPVLFLHPKDLNGCLVELQQI